MVNETLIVGNGEIGHALGEILSEFYPVTILDKEEASDKKFKIMHICFPYNSEFVDNVLRYRGIYDPDFTVIHSTVPVGTSRLCDAIHSPVVGIHPHFKQSILTFTKFLSGSQSSEVADYFRRAGIKVYLFDKQETTEVMKVLSTTFYGVCVEFFKDVKKICVAHEIPFEAWTLWTDNYNKGYSALGFPEYSRPNLVPNNKKIGGHCVLNNLVFLETDFTELIKKKNLE